MARRKEAAPPQPMYNIENCSITNAGTPFPEYGAAAAVELAKAAAANAEAIKRIAEIMRGSDAHMGTGIYCGAPKAGGD